MDEQGFYEEHMVLENPSFQINRAPTVTPPTYTNVNILNVKPSHVNSLHLCSQKLEAYTKERKESYIG